MTSQLGGYQLDPGTTGSPVIDKALAVPLGACSVFLVVDVPAKLLFKLRRDRTSGVIQLGCAAWLADTMSSQELIGSLE